jgi:hypothetical protein
MRPTRWLEHESASADVRKLLASAGRSRALPDEVRTRSMKRLDRYLVWPAAAGVLLWLKGVAIAAGIGVAGVVAVTQIRPMLQEAPVAPVVVEAAPIKSPPVSAAPAAAAPGATTAVVPAPVDPAPAAPAVTPSPVEPERAPSAKPRLPAPTASTPAQREMEMDPLTAEAAMLEHARASLDRDPRASLAELDACAARFPLGALRIERELLAVDALTRVGSREEARRRGETLLAAARGSIYEPRVRSMLDKLGAP